MAFKESIVNEEYIKGCEKKLLEVKEVLHSLLEGAGLVKMLKEIEEE